jgi:hypothetical protein
MIRALASVLLAALTALPAIAFADCYVNPKGDLVGGHYTTLHACHKWGSSVRCNPDRSSETAYATFYFKGDPDIACGVRIQPNGMTKWHASTSTWYHYTPHKQEIRCSQYWVNNNTLDVNGTLVKK